MSNLYSKLKVFHYQTKLDSLKSDAILPPLHVRWKPTNKCNHHCTYCAYRAPDLQLGENMDVRDEIPPDKALEIADDLAAMRVKAVTFSGGGEPFCYPYLLPVAQRLHAGGVKFASLTNGARLTGDVAEFFAQHATWVRVSIDGWDGPSYAQYRGVPESEFSRVIGNLSAFVKLGGPCALSAIINVNKDNAMHVYPLIKTLAEASVKSIKVAPVVVSNRGEENYAYHKPFVRTVRRAVALACADFPWVEIGNNYKADLGSFIKPYTWCPALQVRPVMGADLNVYACQDKAYSPAGLLFSIKEQRFIDGWHKDGWRYKINPARDCNHHCAMDGVNRLILEYLEVGHREFV